ncbi:VWA domain-containing protein [Paenibacillus sp. 481]|uniref:VWA domain-containing protein n=1 Tax=Paenibacillus sp. 481 TaxID=2835869 RepID=UPI001E5F42DE|nr:VWA domain-containing protein [Paenibacillus sp. 481]UHA73479.1 VWA domain-containing protein [Paenibacillus sp. 481]
MTNSTSTLVTGGNVTLNAGNELQVTVSWNSTPAELDVSCFIVGTNGKVASDDYFVFYNQPSDPHGHVKLRTVDARSSTFTIQLDKLSSVVAKCVFAATLDGPGTFADVSGCTVTVRVGGQTVVYDIKEATRETSLVFVELYRHQSLFKLRAVGRGFNGGLKPLAEAHGVVVADDGDAGQIAHPAATVASTPTKISVASSQPATASQSASGSKLHLSKIDLLKKEVQISLAKKGIGSQKARVAVVFDASGSMYHLYNQGTIQRAFERVLAVAASMDDDGEMDVWFFGDNSARTPSVKAAQFEGYVDRYYCSDEDFQDKLGFENNEPEAMRDIIHKYTVESPNDRLPVFIVFFSDGGVYFSDQIAKLLVQSSRHNLFWQFVGLGNSDYGILEEFDNLPGRIVDNCNFFALDDLDRVSDQVLYDRLFNEFPSWLRAARSKGILRT